MESMGIEIVLIKKLNLFLDLITNTFLTEVTRDTVRYFLMSKGITVLSADTKLHLEDGDTCMKFVGNDLYLFTKIKGKQHEMFV